MNFNEHDFCADALYRKIAGTVDNCVSKATPPYIPLYHGSSEPEFTPTFGVGRNTHDYGSGFYTTLSLELAREWATSMNNAEGYVHKYLLDTSELSVLNLNALLEAQDTGSINDTHLLCGQGRYHKELTWLAILAKHRFTAQSKRYAINKDKLITEYYDKAIEDFDVIIGYRADDSYFKFAKAVVAEDADVGLLGELLHTGNLGHQVFIQSERAFSKLQEVYNNWAGGNCGNTVSGNGGNTYFEKVDTSKYSQLYRQRDDEARIFAENLLSSDRNTLQDTLSRYL